MSQKINGSNGQDSEDASQNGAEHKLLQPALYPRQPLRGDAVLLDVIANGKQPDEDAEQQQRPQHAKNQFATEGMVACGFECNIAGNNKCQGTEKHREQERPNRL